MPSHKLHTLWIILAIVLSSCASPSPAPTIQPTAITAPTPTPIPTATSQPTATPDPTSSWLEYKDTANMGISFKYPPSWRVEPSTPLAGYTLNPTKVYSWAVTKTFAGFSKRIPADEIKIEFILVDNPKGNTSEQLVVDLKLNSSDELTTLVSQEDVLIDGVKSVRLNWKDDDGSQSVTFVIAKGQRAYTITAFPSDSTQKDKLALLLSTLKVGLP